MDEFLTLRLFWGLGFLFFVSVVFSAILLLRLVWRNNTPLRSITQKSILAASSMALCFFLLEFFFSYLIVQSDGYGHTLSSKLWFKRYWHPINNEGYRDYQTKHLDGRSVLFVVGDSFVAGHGVKRIVDRFPNRLAEMLGDSWEHVVVAQNGWQTPQELAALQKHQVRPDAIVLSYYINDIQSAAQERGVHPLQYFEPPSPLASKFVDKSFFLNWAYWRVVRGTMGHDYWDYYTHCYSNQEVWNLHCDELRSVIDYARDVHAELYIVVWPNLESISESQEYTSRVVDFFESHDICVVDLADEFRGRQPAQLIVNSLDGHPNPKTHREVASILFEQISTNMAAKREISANKAIDSDEE